MSIEEEANRGDGVEPDGRASSFGSTDDVRSADTLPFAQHVSIAGPIPLELGGSLPSAVCAFETWGELNADASNAVLICHAISGDSHAARHHPEDTPGWWETLIGPGKHIDTNRFFVVCPNVLGGCRGTTGPMSYPDDTAPLGELTGTLRRRYGAEFPKITLGDIVDLQRRLAQHLGIARWRAVVGGSLGGHQALTWAARYPDALQSCVAIASAARLSTQAMGFDVIARNAIQTDPHFAAGQYYDRPQRPDTGLAIARMVGHLTYLSGQAMERKFDANRHDPRQIATIFEQQFSIGSYLAHQGQKFTDRFDANSYITLSMAMDLFDLGENRLALMETFDESRCEFLLISFSSDWLFPPAQSRDIVNALASLGKRVTYSEISSAAGHDGFLIDEDIAKYGPLVEAQLARPISATEQSHAAPQHEQLDPLEQQILSLVPQDASVLDLGCGDGRLLAALADRDSTMDSGRVARVGVEVAQNAIVAAAQRGLDVIDYDLNHGLPSFVDKQFDVVILNHTLQVVANVEQLFDEMLRVGKQVIVSFANFAYRELREDYIERGRSPRATGAYDHRWYDTPNRRFPSIVDVLELCDVKQATVHRAIYLDRQRGTTLAADGDPNLNADTAILLLGRPDETESDPPQA